MSERASDLAILVTGSNGYIGSQIVHKLRAKNHPFIALSRSSPANPYQLSDGQIDLPPDCKLEAIFHLAADIGQQLSLAEEQAALQILLELARQQNAPLFFASSFSAIHPVGEYGRRKAALEAMVLAKGHYVIRLGLVYGGPSKGLFSYLENFCANHFFLPYMFPPLLIQPIHLSQAADAFIALGISRPAQHLFHIAGDPMAFSDFLLALRRIRLGKTALPLPLPKIALALAARIKLLPHSERLRALLHTPRVNCQEDLRQAGIVPFPINEGLGSAEFHLATARDFLPPQQVSFWQAGLAALWIGMREMLPALCRRRV